MKVDLEELQQKAERGKGNAKYFIKWAKGVCGQIYRNRKQTVELHEAFINLKNSLLEWLAKLQEETKVESEVKLFTFLQNKIHDIFENGNRFDSDDVQYNPRDNPCTAEFKRGIEILEEVESSELNKNIVHAVKRLEPMLEWYVKKGEKTPVDATQNFEYVNCNIVGKRGVIHDEDLTIGITVMDPNSVYPAHNHVEEEFYVVLNTGSWNQNNGLWMEKTLGDYVYNPSNIVHSTKSGDDPLVTIWFHYNPSFRDKFNYEMNFAFKAIMEIKDRLDGLAEEEAENFKKQFKQLIKPSSTSPEDYAKMLAHFQNEVERKLTDF